MHVSGDVHGATSVMSSDDQSAGLTRDVHGVRHDIAGARLRRHGLTSRLEVTLNLTSRLNMTLQLTSRLSMALNLTSRVTLQVIAASIQNETLVCARAADLRDVETSSRQVAEGFLVFGSHRVLDRRGRFVVDRS